MNDKIPAWECDCGHVEYGEFPPGECNKCWQVNGFMEINEDRAEKLGEGEVLDEMRKESGGDEGEDDE